MAEDKYGNDLILKDGDFVFKSRGDFMTTDDYEQAQEFVPFKGHSNIIFSTFNRLTTVLGEIPFHPDYGSNLPLLVSKNNNQDLKSKILVEMYNVLEQDPRIEDIVDIEVNQNGRYFNMKAELLLTGKSDSSVFIFPNFFIND
jgi:phage baseplate assembly protein W